MFEIFAKLKKWHKNIKRDQLREGVDGLLKQLAKNRPTLPTRGQCGIQKSVHDGDVQVVLLFRLIALRELHSYTL